MQRRSKLQKSGAVVVGFLFGLVFLPGYVGPAEVTREPSSSRWPVRRTAVLSLCITEIMYHPAPGGAEFIELSNRGDTPLDLSGFYFSEGVELIFATGTIVQPGEYIVLASPEDEFSRAYPGVTVTAWYQGRLSNGGERLTVCRGSSQPVCSVSYDDEAPWPHAADGQGYSLVLDSSGRGCGARDDWRASLYLGGSPGAEDADLGIPRVLVNEVLSCPEGSQLAAVELWNPTADVADIRGWFLTDDPVEPRKAKIPDQPEYVLSPDGYVVLSETVLRDEPGVWQGIPLPGFAINACDGGGVFLFSADRHGSLSGYAHGFLLEAATQGVSFGRYLTTDAVVHVVAQRVVTLGQVNAGPSVGPVVFAEIYYHPPLGEGIEFVRLRNISELPVVLNPGQESASWTIQGIGFSFPPGARLEAQRELLVVNSDPVVFRESEQVPDEIGVFGPFGQGTRLNNAGETLTLMRPGISADTQAPLTVVERVGYDDRAPWPDAAGNGDALRRRRPEAYGNESTSWDHARPCFNPEHCEPAEDLSERVFDPTRMHEMEIELQETDWQDLRHQSRNVYQSIQQYCQGTPFSDPFTYFAATMILDGIVMDEALGVCKKGFHGSLRVSKPALKVKLDQYASGQTLYGLRLLTLNNNVQDPSLLRQCLAAQLMASAGVCVPRCTLMQVSVNGEDLGVYSHVESVKGPLLERCFGNRNGALFEGVFSDLRPGWTGTLEMKSDPQGGDLEVVERLVTALESPDSELVAALESCIDLEQFLTFWAMEVLLGHWDGYAGDTNNYYLYHDPDADRLRFIPWGMDRTFSDDNPLHLLASRTGTFAAGYLALRLYRYQPTRERYVERVVELLDTVWDEQALASRIDQIAGLATPFVPEDDMADFLAAVEQTRDFVMSRRGQLLAVLQPSPPDWTEPLPRTPCLNLLNWLCQSWPILCGVTKDAAVMTTTPACGHTAELSVSP